MEIHIQKSPINDATPIQPLDCLSVDDFLEKHLDFVKILYLYINFEHDEWTNLDKMQNISILSEEIANRYLDISDLIASRVVKERSMLASTMSIAPPAPSTESTQIASPAN